MWEKVTEFLLSQGILGVAAPLLGGYVFEWLVYDGALSTADQDTVRAYLNNKWAIY